MENFNIRKLKAVHIAANFTEDIEKAERKQLTGGSWKTINGAKVYVKGSKVVAGAEGKLSGEGGSKSGSSKSSEGSGSKATSKEIKEYLKYNPSKTKEQAEKYLNSMKAMSKFKTGTPVTFKDKMGRKVSGEVVNKNGKKQVSLYRDDNYSGSSERLVSPDWSKVESFNESNTKESISKSQTMEDNIEKGKRVPVGTVSRGYKKVAEGKWVPVKDEKKKVETKKEGGSKNSK